MAMNDTEIISSLKKIVDSVGVEAFANHARANALVSDYFPGNDNAKTRKLIKSIIDVDAFAKISSASNSDLDGVCKAVKSLLVDDESLSEDRAEMAVGWVCGALGKRKPNFPKPVQPKPQQTQTTSSGSSSSYSGQSSNNGYSPTRQTTQQPRTVSTPSNNTYGLNLNHHVKRKKKVPKKLIGWTITLCVLAALAYFVVWPKMIYPNMANENLHTPEIIQTYSGTYSIGSTEGDAIVTITSCDQSGNLTGFFEFIVGNTYGKYEVSGKITEKKNNGNLVLSLTPGQWGVQPEDYTPLEMMTVEITDNYQSFECSQYSMYWAVGENDEYFIKTVNDLQKLTGSNATYQLKNDIDLAGVNWKPIEGFAGTLIGNGFTIKNLNINTSASNVGFFSTLSGTVRNINFDNAKITVSGSNENVGILCGQLSGSLMKVSVSGSVDANSCNYVGGVVGNFDPSEGTTITDVENKASVSGAGFVGGIVGHIKETRYSLAFNALKNSGNIESAGDYVGGIIGYCNNYDSSWDPKTTLSYSSNTGNVSGNYYVGGIFGYATCYAGGTIQSSTCAATITGKAYIGCIAGEATNIVVDNCKNAGSTIVSQGYTLIDGTKYSFVGGFVGKGSRATNCVNEVDIDCMSGGYRVGGVIGSADMRGGDATLSNLENKASIKGIGYVGGIVGYINDTRYSLTFNTLKNSGTIESTGDYVGGAIGYCYNYDSSWDPKTTLSDSSNTGNVSGNYYVGGIFGYATCYAGGTIQSSTCAATITGKAYIGCIAGEATNIVVDNCKNAGSTIVSNGYILQNDTKCSYVGGFVGRGSRATNCTNEVNIDCSTGGYYVGGIIGSADMRGGNSTLSNLENKATVKGVGYVGGIVGHIRDSRYSLTFSTLKNTGNIYSSGDYVGGIIGYCDNYDSSWDPKLSAVDCTNAAQVKGTNYVGGIFGYVKAYSGKIYGCSSSGTIVGASNYGEIAGLAERVTIE